MDEKTRVAGDQYNPAPQSGVQPRRQDQALMRLLPYFKDPFFPLNSPVTLSVRCTLLLFRGSPDVTAGSTSAFSPASACLGISRPLASRFSAATDTIPTSIGALPHRHWPYSPRGPSLKLPRYLHCFSSAAYPGVASCENQRLWSQLERHTSHVADLTLEPKFPIRDVNGQGDPSPRS